MKELSKKSKLKDKIDRLKSLFWEYKLESLKKNLKSPIIIARVLEMGNPEQFRIFSSLVGDETIYKFVEEKGKKMLSKRSFNYWKLYYEKKINKNS